jgi:hypothetical protein
LRASVKLFNYKIYLKEFLTIFFCYFFFEQCVSWVFTQNAQLNNITVKAISIGIFAYLLTEMKALKTSEKLIVGIFTVLICKLVLQSLLQFHSVFKHFQIFYVIFPVVYTIFIKHLFRKWNANMLEFVAGFYLIIYFVFMALFGHEFSFSLNDTSYNTGPFSGDSRILHAQSVYMIIIPFLWYLNKFISTKKGGDFMLFLLCFVIILIHNHRSVWSAAIFAMMMYFIVLVRNSAKSLSGVTAFFAITFSLLLFSLTIISSVAPELLGNFASRFSEILNPAKEGSTGGFRLEQAAIYMGFIVEKPVFGWSFEGFDLDNPYVDWWESGTGHHFHHGYIEVLFYHGVVGLILKYSFLIYILFKAFSKKLNKEAIILVPFCISGLLFSFNYTLPLVFWGHVGMCLYYIEKLPTYYYIKDSDELVLEE